MVHHSQRDYKEGITKNKLQKQKPDGSAGLCACREVCAYFCPGANWLKSVMLGKHQL